MVPVATASPVILWSTVHFLQPVDANGRYVVHRALGHTVLEGSSSVPMHVKPPHAFALTVPANTADHAIGLENAPVTIVEYGDFECPNCKQAAPAVNLLLNHFKDRIRFV